MGRHVFITLGQVVNVKEGAIDIRPMVMAVAGDGAPIAHGVVYNVPVWRLQGGDSAVIMPPRVGDIGFLAICDRDISGVKATRQPSMPGARTICRMLSIWGAYSTARRCSLSSLPISKSVSPHLGKFH